MKIDFKFWYIRRDDNGFIEEAAIRLYEGDDQTVTVKSVLGLPDKQEVQYVRSKRLGKEDLTHFKDKFTRKEKNGNDSFIYKAEDFGAIKTDDELHQFLKKELKKEKGREPIKEQK